MSAKPRFQLQTKPSRISGQGVFAMEDVPWGMKIVEFTGALIDDHEAGRRTRAGASAIMELGDGMNIDGFDRGGSARLGVCFGSVADVASEARDARSPLVSGHSERRLRMSASGQKRTLSARDRR